MNETHYIAGIGFSAGGLDPLQKFFDNTLHDSVTYVVVQHLPLNYRSNLDIILKRNSTLTILQVEDGLTLGHDAIYVTPPSSYIRLHEGKFQVEARSLTRPFPNESVDKFFLSLAAAKGEQAIGILLSGGGDDGLRGAQAIKENGGLIIVQDPATTSQSSMPQNIIAAGLADFVADPGDIPAIIRKHVESHQSRF